MHLRFMLWQVLLMTKTAFPISFPRWLRLYPAHVHVLGFLLDLQSYYTTCSALYYIDTTIPCLDYYNGVIICEGANTWHMHTYGHAGTFRTWLGFLITASDGSTIYFYPLLQVITACKWRYLVLPVRIVLVVRYSTYNHVLIFGYVRESKCRWQVAS